MHELAVTQAILELSLEHAPGGARVTDLYVVRGELSSYVDDSVQFYWDVISAGTAAEGATLHFRSEEAEMACERCGQRYSPRQALPCPACGSTQVTVVSGEAFYLEAIEVDGEAVGGRH